MTFENEIVLQNQRETIIMQKDLEDPNSCTLLLRVNPIIKQSKAIECTFFVYPYDSNMDHSTFNLLPYEEYVGDVDAGRRSTYQKLEPTANKVFGLFLGFFIAFIFWLFKPSELYSLQSLIAILGAYTLGKEMWSDLDKWLTDTTKTWNIRWRGSLYFYIKEDFGTIQRFWKLARIRRNGKPTILPLYLDFMTHSNAKTVESYFDQGAFTQHKENTTVQFGNIVFNPEFESNLKTSGAMYGFKLSIQEKMLLGNMTYEIFQAKDKEELGAVDKYGKWCVDAVLYRKVWNLGRIKLYLLKEIVDDFKLIKNI